MKKTTRRSKRQESMVERIKEQIRKSGRGMASFIRLSPDNKIRIRFVSDFKEAAVVLEHGKWGILSPTPCLKHHFGKDCEFCKIPDVSTKDTYCWTVYDYQAKKRKIFKWPATSRSPVAQLVAIFDTYKTLLDRDYVLSRRGARFDTVYTIMPLDKRKIGKKLKQFTKDEILEKCIEFSGEIDYDDIENLPEEIEEDAEFSEFEEDEEDLEEEELEEEDEEDEEDLDDEDDENDEDEEDEFGLEDEEEAKPKKRRRAPKKRIRRKRK